MIDLTCPNCGATMEEDASGRTAICPFCMGKVIINENQTNYSSVNQVMRAKNYHILAEQAYSMANYREAHAFYTKILEENQEDALAHVRKGLSVVYYTMNDKVADTELKEELKLASYIVIEENQKAAFLKTKDDDIMNLWRFIKKNYSIKSECYSSDDEVLRDMRHWLNYITVIDVVLDYITDKSFQLKIAESAWKYCSSIKDVSYEYRDENSFNIANFREVQVDKAPYEQLSDKCRKIVQNIVDSDEEENVQRKMSGLAKEMKLSGELKKCRELYDAKESVILKQNPKLKHARTKNLLLRLLLPMIVGGCALLILAFQAIMLLAVGNTFFSMEVINACYIVIALDFVIALVIVIVFTLDKNKTIRKLYPENMKKLKLKIEELEAEINKIKEESIMNGEL